MATIVKITISSSPTVSEIEDKIQEILALPDGVTIDLTLPRNTSGPVLGDVWIVTLLATASGRKAPCIVRDSHSEWEGKGKERFLTRLDGLAVLALARAGKCDLLNTKDQRVPIEVVDSFASVLTRGGRVERDDAGVSRTYVAIDPEYSVPLDLNTRSSHGLQNFRNAISTILRQFGRPQQSLLRGSGENEIYEAVFEIFQNTFEHGRQTGDDEGTGMRYARFRKHMFNAADDIASRCRDFPQLEAFFRQHKDVNGHEMFLEISIGDEGEGIVAHYQRTKGLADGDDPALLQQLITTNLSSKRLSGAGHGLPNTMGALQQLGAFVVLRTGTQWLYRDFSTEQSGAQMLKTVVEKQLARVIGTCFTFILPLQN